MYESGNGFCRARAGNALPYHWNVFSSSHGLKMGSVVGYSVFVLFLLSVPSSLRSGYVANMMGNCSLMDFSRLLGVTMNYNEKVGKWREYRFSLH